MAEKTFVDVYARRVFTKYKMHLNGASPTMDEIKAKLDPPDQNTNPPGNGGGILDSERLQGPITGTLITIADTTTKNVEDLAKDDALLPVDPADPISIFQAPQTQTLACVTFVTDGGKTLTVTQTQLIRKGDGGGVPAFQLAIGDEVATLDGIEVIVSRHEEGNMETQNVYLTKRNWYAANDVWIWGFGPSGAPTIPSNRSGRARAGQLQILRNGEVVLSVLVSTSSPFYIPRGRFGIAAKDNIIFDSDTIYDTFKGGVPDIGDHAGIALFTDAFNREDADALGFEWNQDQQDFNNPVFHIEDHGLRLGALPNGAFPFAVAIPGASQVLGNEGQYAELVYRETGDDPTAGMLAIRANWDSGDVGTFKGYIAVIPGDESGAEPISISYVNVEDAVIEELKAGTVENEPDDVWRFQIIETWTSNQPPDVDAGADHTFTGDAPYAYTLLGSATDDMLPTGSNDALTYVWTVESQPVGSDDVTFDDDTDPTTNVHLPAFGGAYTLRLTCSDTQLTGFDELILTVPNQAPVVNASADDSIEIETLPDTFTLTGTASDADGPAALTYLWEIVSKPMGASDPVFGNATHLSTDVTVDTYGAYVFRLTADDTTDTTSDEVTITITEPEDCVTTYTDTFTDAVSNGYIDDPNGGTWDVTLPTGNANAGDSDIPVFTAGGKLKISNDNLTSSNGSLAGFVFEKSCVTDPMEAQFTISNWTISGAANGGNSRASFNINLALSAFGVNAARISYTRTTNESGTVTAENFRTNGHGTGGTDLVTNVTLSPGDTISIKIDAGVVTSKINGSTIHTRATDLAPDRPKMTLQLAAPIGTFDMTYELDDFQFNP